jgi:hypothetical protein
VEQALTTGVRDVLVDAAHRAVTATERGWRLRGAEVLLDPPLRTSADLVARTDASLAHWRDGVVALVTSEGGSRRGRARGVAAGINGVAVVLMVATFGATGGLTGAEVGIAAAAALASQKALESVFGSRAVSRLTDEVRSDLLERVRALLDREASLLLSRLDDLEAPSGLGPAVRAEADALDAERPRVTRVTRATR